MTCERKELKEEEEEEEEEDEEEEEEEGSIVHEREPVHRISQVNVGVKKSF